MLMKSCHWLVIVLAAGACRMGPKTDVPAPIHVPPGAGSVRVMTEQGGQVAVTYVVEDAYPGTRTREALAQRLRGHGFSPLDHDALDPSVRIEANRAFSRYSDARSRPTMCVLELVEDWQKGTGDVVRQSLTYSEPCPDGTPPRDDLKRTSLRVNAVLMPAARVTELRDTRRR